MRQGAAREAVQQEPRKSNRPSGASGLITVALASALACLPSEAATKQPTQCGQGYVVARGDTLFEIAERAYGDGWLYKDVFKANTDVLPSAAAVEVGEEIFLPCFEGEGPQTRKEAIIQGLMISELSPIDSAEFIAAHSYMAGIDDAETAMAEIATAETAMAEIDSAEVIAAQSYMAGIDDAEIAMAEIATAEIDDAGKNAAVASAFDSNPTWDIARESDAADIAIIAVIGTDAAAAAETNVDTGDVGVAELGAADAGVLEAVSAPALGKLAGLSLNGGGMVTDILDRATANAGLALRPNFVNNRAGHLDLLAQGNFQIGYPWVRPDCESGAELDPVSRRLCTEFTFSAPILELSVSFFGRREVKDNLPQTHAELAGLRICRPDGGFALSLILPGQMDDATGGSAAQCFVELLLGSVDLVAIDRAEGHDIIARVNGGSTVIKEIEALALARTAHAIAPTARADAVAALGRVDRGLGELMISGKWFEIIVVHQRRQMAQLN